MFVLRFVSILLVFSSLEAICQPVLTNLKGRVSDVETSEPLPGVEVRYSGRSVQTNADGQFSLMADSVAGELFFRCVGYKDLRISFPFVGEFALLEMEPNSYLLSTAVVSASKYERPIAESAVSMSVINAEMPSRLNSLSVEKALDRISGVQLIDGQANIRGGSGYSYGAGSRVLLMLDDLPMMQSDAAVPYWDDLPAENLRQIEVIKGASSALYGSAAMNGVVHFRSEEPSTEPFTEIVFSPTFYLDPGNGKAWWPRDAEEAQPYEAYMSLAHRQRFAHTDISLSASYRDKMGYNKGSDASSFRMGGRVRWHLSDSLLLGLGANLNTGTSSDFFYWEDNGLFEGAEGATTSTQKTRLSLDPTLRWQNRNGFLHKIIGRYYFIQNGADNDQDNSSHSAYLEYQLRKHFDGLGLDAFIGFAGSASWTRAALYSDTTFRVLSPSAYVQLEKRLFERLSILGGLRFEHYGSLGPGKVEGRDVEQNQSDSRTIYRLGLNWHVVGASYLRASLGEGFRFPSVAEKYISTTAGGLRIAPNPELRSEFGRSWEIGLRQGYKVLGAKGMIDVAYFDSRYFDMMEFVLNNQLQFQSRNIGNTKIRGLECELQLQRPFSWGSVSFQFGYTRINPQYLEFDLLGKDLPINERENAPIGQQNAANSSAYENILKYRSRDLLRMDLSARKGNFFAGYSFQYASHVEAIDWLFQVTLFIKGIADFRAEHDHGYRLHDFRFGVDLDQWTLQLNLFNALNEAYTVRPGLMEAPRNLSFRINYRL
ncbi:MAG: TonB-dependent receptor [Saprospiraceae bacterium]|nr:TonB-dependent receptor [Saprospiraceae bacterium]MBP9208880.1 TonB-dependent receptor [Saprospiraceae bacterium]